MERRCDVAGYPLAVMFGDETVEVFRSVQAGHRRLLENGLALIRQRAVSEEDAAEARSCFQEAIDSGCSVAHLCLAELDWLGASPQDGVDMRSAAASILAFLEVDEEGQATRHASADRQVATHLIHVLEQVEVDDLLPCSASLLSLASHELPELRIVALRVFLSGAEGRLCSADAPKDFAIKPRILCDFFDEVLLKMSHYHSENAKLRRHVQAQEGLQDSFAASLEAEQERRAQLEAQACDSALELEVYQLSNSNLSHKVDQLESDLIESQRQLQSCLQELQRRSPSWQQQQQQLLHQQEAREQLLLGQEQRGHLFGQEQRGHHAEVPYWEGLYTRQDAHQEFSHLSNIGAARIRHRTPSQERTRWEGPTMFGASRLFNPTEKNPFACGPAGFAPRQE